MTPALLLSLAASLTAAAPSKPDRIRCYPDDTVAVVVIDCEKFLQSKPVKQIIGNKGLIEFWKEQVSEKERADFEANKQLQAFLDELLGTKRLVVTIQNDDVGRAFVPSFKWMAFLEGSYDPEVFRAQLKSYRSEDKPLITETYGDYEIMGVGDEKTVTTPSLVLYTTDSDPKAARLKSVLSRLSGKTKPNLNKAFADALADQPTEAPPLFAVCAIAPFKKDSVPGLLAFDKDLTRLVAAATLDDGGVHIKITETCADKEAAATNELATLTAVRKVANNIAEEPGAEPRFAKPIKAAVVDRSGNLVTVEILLPNEWISAVVQKVKEQAKAGNEAPKK